MISGAEVGICVRVGIAVSVGRGVLDGQTNCGRPVTRTFASLTSTVPPQANSRSSTIVPPKAQDFFMESPPDDLRLARELPMFVPACVPVRVGDSTFVLIVEWKPQLRHN